ncbi:MAG: hypothetical protein COB67_06200 [SAR324 cluster bacterium]|uniref:Uncharacterized protein n=1 Tax=SAR324 cluster bacterium TaxID=2024889 RepID=A0A2A4T4R6_9DELT|nr:MAG: hypothetical protein COB67_06200 [SAR324 cluster bacterium]
MTYQSARTLVLQDHDYGFYATDEYTPGPENAYYLQSAEGCLYVTKSSCKVTIGDTPEDTKISLLEEELDEGKYWRLLEKMEWHLMD